MQHPDISRAIMQDRVRRMREEAKAAAKAAKAKGRNR
ncbi:hypothetical protein SAMN04489712_102489 [Thermomonospora echinospora]|uniref:Uncharacterized protein n=1 Tax=Thermomonospora echinospora TaxID=1992 RepID=A0A1H5VWD9_9ACTN|nr:hypothetical protein SAMN04489712_102489 [Thermomonospora echinospora]